MKKIKYLFILLIPFLVTGCVKVNGSMKIKMDKSMDYEVIEAVDTSMMGEEDNSSSDNQLIDNEELEDAKRKGFTVEDYTEDNLKGFKISKHFKNIDIISTEDDVKTDISMDGDNQYIFKVKKGFFKNTYTATLTSESSDQVNQYANENTTSTDSSIDLEDNQQMYESLASQMDLKFTVELPFKAKSNNATTTSKGGKKLEWDLLKHHDDIQFTFVLYNIGNILAVFGIIIVGIIGIVIGYIKTKDNNKSNDTMNNSTPNNNPIDNNQINQNIQTNQINNIPNSNTINNDPFATQMNQNILQEQANNALNTNFSSNKDPFTTDQMNQNIQANQINNNIPNNDPFTTNQMTQPNNSFFQDNQNNNQSNNNIFNQNFPK